MFEMLCCSRNFTQFLNAKARQVFEHYEARQLGWTFVFVGRLLQKYHAPFGGNIFWARKPAGLEQSRPALHDTPHSLSQIVLCTCAFLRYFQRSFVVINFQDWGSFDAATVSTGGLWKVRPWEEEKLEEEEEEKVEASRSCFFRSSRALRTVRSRGALEAAVAPAIRTFPDQ